MCVFIIKKEDTLSLIFPVSLFKRLVQVTNQWERPVKRLRAVIGRGAGSGRAGHRKWSKGF